MPETAPDLPNVFARSSASGAVPRWRVHAAAAAGDGEAVGEDTDQLDRPDDQRHRRNAGANNEREALEIVSLSRASRRVVVGVATRYGLKPPVAMIV